MVLVTVNTFECKLPFMSNIKITIFTFHSSCNYCVESSLVQRYQTVCGSICRCQLGWFPGADCNESATTNPHMEVFRRLCFESLEEASSDCVVNARLT